MYGFSNRPATKPRDLILTNILEEGSSVDEPRSFEQDEQYLDECLKVLDRNPEQLQVNMMICRVIISILIIKPADSDVYWFQDNELFVKLVYFLKRTHKSCSVSSFIIETNNNKIKFAEQASYSQTFLACDILILIKPPILNSTGWGVWSRGVWFWWLQFSCKHSFSTQHSCWVSARGKQCFRDS